jgi:hypothetical protein
MRNSKQSTLTVNVAIRSTFVAINRGLRSVRMPNPEAMRFLAILALARPRAEACECAGSDDPHQPQQPSDLRASYSTQYLGSWRAKRSNAFTAA